ncbi:MAG TPA: cytochrome c biogenesis protein CcsA [Pseudomonadales bacterium]|nr:cytochrome c biogenesis protein CcsA [Pseudomonadales bacterium]
MDINSLLALTAIALYGFLAVRHWGDANASSSNRRDHLLALLAISMHWWLTIQLTMVEGGYLLSFINTGGIVAAFVTSMVFLASLKQPINSLASPTYGIAAFVVFVILIDPLPAPAADVMSGGLLSHVLLSLLGYATLTLAAIHALALALQEQRLKARQTSRLLRFLPPLQTMEKLLFQIIWAGEILLTMGIISGALFLEDIFAQHLVHKTVLSLLAWCIFALLLWGRHVLGWRGNTAVKLTLSGFAVLMLAFFGSKLVLEVILQRA